MSRPVYSDGGELADAYELSKHARMLYAFLACSRICPILRLASIAVLSGSWPPLGVSHIFDTILVFFAFWLSSYSETYPLISLFSDSLCSLRSAAATRLFFRTTCLLTQSD